MTMRMHRCAGLPPRRRTALLQAARRHSHAALLRRTAARLPSPAALLHRPGVHPRHAVHLRSRAVLRRRPVRAAALRRPVRIHRARQSADLPEPRLLHRPERDLPAVRSVKAALLPRIARAAHRPPCADLPAVPPHPAAALLSVRTATAEQCARTILLPPIGKPLPYV